LHVLCEEGVEAREGVLGHLSDLLAETFFLLAILAA
jgi:hypothetical protein